MIRIREITPRYFETFRTPLIKGRALEDADRDREPAVMLSESAERILFAGERALDRRVQPYPEGPWYTVVGVVADVRNGQRVIDEPEPEIYAIARRGAWGRAPAVAIGRLGQLALRTTASPVDAGGFLRQIVADLDPRLVVTIETVEEQVTRLTAQPRFVAWLLSAFAALALLLAATGLYSVVSYLVLQRRRDIGVRMAIGASPRDVAGQVMGEAGRWIIGGAVAGSVLGWMGTRALQSQLYQVEALDPWSWTLRSVRARAGAGYRRLPAGVSRRPRRPGRGIESGVAKATLPEACGGHCDGCEGLVPPTTIRRRDAGGARGARRDARRARRRGRAAAQRRLGNALQTREVDAPRLDCRVVGCAAAGCLVHLALVAAAADVRAGGHARAGDSASAPPRRCSQRSIACSSGRCRTRIRPDSCRWACCPRLRTEDSRTGPSRCPTGATCGHGARRRRRSSR